MKWLLWSVGIVAVFSVAFLGWQCLGRESGDVLEKPDLIRIASIHKGQIVHSPLVIKGEARGYWFFEASFPVHLTDAAGNPIAVAIAQAESEWMTEDFVPFRAELVFDEPEADYGILTFKKDNPSGLPEHDDELQTMVRFRD